VLDPVACAGLTGGLKTSTGVTGAPRTSAATPVPRAGVASIVPRPRLQERLDETFGKRLTMLVAGPGYGKTTLLAAWCADVACAWYALGPEDVALDQVTRGIVGALLPAVPAVSASLASVGSMHDAASRETDRADSVAGLLCHELGEALTHDVVLVLDDVHELVEGSGGARLVQAICRQSPPLLHVVIASRAPPPFPIQRLRGRGEVLELTSADLAFTLDECELACRTLGEPDEAAVGRLHSATGGWPAAVRLAVEAARTAPEPEAVLKRLARPEGALHAYLAEEVLAHETPAVRELLRRTCVLDPVSAELCDAIGAAGAAEALADLARSGLAAEAGDGWFSVHALVREFVAGAWPLTDREADEVHTAAAAWFEAHGLHARALGLLAEADSGAAIARLLGARGREILARCGAEMVVRFGALAPVEALSGEGDLALGEAYTIRGESDRALEHLLRAARGRRRVPAAVSWRLVAAFHLLDDLDEAVAAYGRARLLGADPEDAALLLAWTASAEHRRGNHRMARALAERGLRFAEQAGDDRALALAHTACALVPDGRMSEAERHLRRALNAAERAGDLFLCARVRNNRGSQLLEQGRYAEAIEELNRTMQLAELGGFTNLLALATMNRGLCDWCLGRLDEAAADYEAAAALYRRSCSGEEAYAVVGLGDVHRERGDVVLARARYEEGLALAERTGDRQALVPALYQLAKVLVDDEPERADELARRAVGYGWPDLPWALNASGWIALAHGDREQSAEIAGRAAAAARERRDPFGLAESLELQALAAPVPAAAKHLLEEALRQWRHLGNAVHGAAVELALARFSEDSAAHRVADRAERRLQRLGVRISAAGPAGLLRFVAERRDVPLALETLGGFRVVREGLPVPAADWRSQKARDLLKILVARRGAPVPREMLMEALWPGVDVARSANRLSVALSTVRSVLAPGKRDDPDRYVRAAGDAVALVLEHVVVDVEEFLAEAMEGLELHAASLSAEAGERLEHAIALYRGDFLEEDAYDEWAVPLREQARALHSDVAHTLAEDAVAAGRYDEAAGYSLRVLDRDRYDERAHLGLVTSQVAGGRHGEAGRAYRAYCRRMEEIGIESAPFPVRV
jgi:ATP/maltotriose-dependent transcriptional regulator MalT/DNA-binding SARP family transcriptional activator